MNEKEGIVRYVRTVRKLLIAFSAVAVPLFFVCLTFAIARYAAFWIVTPVLGVLYFTVYGVYVMRVSLGTVLGIQLTEELIYVKTLRKTFAYDRREGCVSVTKKGKKYVATFRTQDAQDSFLFYSRVLFSPYCEEQFTAEEMSMIYPAFNPETDGANA